MTLSSTGRVTVSNADGVLGTAGVAWLLTNLGTIKDTGTVGNGVHLTAGGKVTNGATSATGALIQGAVDGIYINGGVGTVVNNGTILGTSHYGVNMQAAGSVVNTSTGLI